ncbi:hypothetical protein QEN63_gp26 [Streptomyces phage Vondra]|uniref:DUF7848 domain-containing protein n=1 Tax=Streptomyces phage Vondra TaxID=2736273 RepID=A0A6M9Z3P6_9CAUD|nr:hypothetical protein QEN63_gp26 [Streptomyces phage Vondra]QKN87611.1 hypothetical protein SEA_VONDRA_26 [Streptomyces phage Vondra]
MRSVLRYVTHRIATAPESEVTISVRCLTPGCGWSLGATADIDAANQACMTHTGRLHDHVHFERLWSDVAEVQRVEGA